MLRGTSVTQCGAGLVCSLGQLDLDELREEAAAVFGCVEARTGEEFGELTYDEFGYLTEQGQLAHDAAFEYQDHEPFGVCRNDLGYEADVQAETKTLVECVEEKTGEDFGGSATTRPVISPTKVS